METLQIILLVAALFALTLGMYWLDSKHNWQLVSWFNGKAVNPFTPAQEKTFSGNSSSADAAKIRALQERIEVLEKIVTEPEYELNRKINQLK
ncbi:hypothetical protein QTP81_16620 [Alteromonas sp. ASW11-36]|uniref:Uncharacterized protein n=1 Tax=Alteromonas arenosi TaxID=3055817 RepID=A0ABT7T354_9ALTE|nr:hypothetical protein [Alteromonas sp. ASW11-36]MDM7862232.1 hypothetical protein [Alteromonas sp. ASW11-36]